LEKKLSVSNSLHFDESIHEPPADQLEFEKASEDGSPEPKPQEEKPSRSNRKITKVKDLLRESQESALKMNRADLDTMFNLPVGDAASSQDGISKQYMDKIASLREQQKALLPLFLQSQSVVARHKRCLKVILNENEENIPY
jgi:hypothetical protein